jgi:hypothetical protein
LAARRQLKEGILSQRVDAYIAAMAARDDAQQEVEALVSRLREYAEPLIGDWRQLREAVMEKSLLARLAEKLFGRNIPTPEEIRSAMVEFFEAEAEVLQAWSRLSDDEQKYLVPPDHKKSTDKDHGE